MLKFGTVHSIDYEKGLAKVLFPADDLVSPWLHVSQQTTKGSKDYGLPAIDTPVACLMDEHNEEGVIVGAIYNDKNQPDSSQRSGVRSVIFSDGTKVEYNQNTSQLLVNVSGNVTIEAGEVTIDGDLKVTGSVEADSEVTANAGVASVSLSTHNHPANGSPPTAGT